MMARGSIVDIHWADQRDRRWLRQNVTPKAYREIVTFPEWMRREMSVYRCAECGEFGALQGIGEEALLTWHVKRHRCATCIGGAQDAA